MERLEIGFVGIFAILALIGIRVPIGVAMGATTVVPGDEDWAGVPACWSGGVLADWLQPASARTMAETASMPADRVRRRVVGKDA